MKNPSKKHLKHIDYLDNMIKTKYEYPYFCYAHHCDFYEDGACNAGHDAEMWCEYSIFERVNYIDNMRYEYYCLRIPTKKEHYLRRRRRRLRKYGKI